MRLETRFCLQMETPGVCVVREHTQAVCSPRISTTFSVFQLKCSVNAKTASDITASPAFLFPLRLHLAEFGSDLIPPVQALGCCDLGKSFKCKMLKIRSGGRESVAPQAVR